LALVLLEKIDSGEYKKDIWICENEFIAEGEWRYASGSCKKH